MKDNIQSWKEFVDEASEYPETLSGVEYKLEKRIVKVRRKRRAIYSSFSLVTAAFLFVILVNTSTVFASGIANVPVIGKLAEFVRFDKGLSSAIENEYVQEVGLTSKDGQEQLLLPYVLADEKNLILFFQLPKEFKQESNEWVNINLKKMTNKMTGEKVEGFAYSTASLPFEGREENNGFILQRYHFSEGELPTSIELEVVVDIESQEIQGVDSPVVETTEVGTFTFQVDFEKFADPIIYEMNENYTILGQKMTLEEMKVYPTGTQVTFTFPKENTAIINGIDLQIEQDGKNILKGSSGISAINAEDDSWMSVFIESNYFEEPKEQELLIQSIRLLDEEEEFITVDLDKKTITPAIAGMELTEVSKKEGKATLMFTTEISQNEGFAMFNQEYQEETGNSFDMGGQGMSVFDSRMETIITVKYPANGKIILQRVMSPKQILEEPIRIKLPIQK